ncbi:Uncharacterised protein [Mycobacteroides abscessus subsp. abscessus]|nr:Uncharacterised protein [Mycobacteroides abscessus subsp. abscessus]
MASAKSSRRAITSSQARRRISARSRGAVAAQDCCTAVASSRAIAPSAAAASATVVRTAPVAGLCTGNRVPVDDGTCLPPIHRSVGIASINVG